MPPCLEAPRRMFELYLVLCRPFSKYGLLGDEAVAAALRALVDPVHLALLDPVLLIVMVRDSVVIGSAVRKKKKVMSKRFLKFNLNVFFSFLVLFFMRVEF